MLNVITPDEAANILSENFEPLSQCEMTALSSAAGRYLSEDMISEEYVPGFNRSTVDGYAIKAADSFGCSESIPAILNVQGKIAMGSATAEELRPGCCFEIPTGGAIPMGADAVVMLEYTENYGDGTVGILRPAAPGSNCIFKGDDLKPKDILLHKGRRLSAADIGSLASMGICKVPVSKKLKVGIISTGDELVEIDKQPDPGQIRNVNSALLAAACTECGAEYIDYGIIKDNEKSLSDAIDKAVIECDAVLISGGSSAGEKDNTAKLLKDKGELLFHGIAIKPGKPTMLAKINEKPVFGIAGHPGAAFFIMTVFVKPFFMRLMGSRQTLLPRQAILTETIESNNGRAQLIAVKLQNKNGKLFASPVISKSGLITSLAGIDAYIFIDRECEGLTKGNTIGVYDVI